MKKVFQNTGRVLFCLLPALLAFGLQIVVSFAGVILKAFSVIAADPSLLSDVDMYIDTLMHSLNGPFLAGVSAVYAVLAALALGFWYWKRFAPKKTKRRSIGEIIHPKMIVGLLLLMSSMQYLSTYLVNLVSAINPAWYQTYEDLMNGIGFDNVSLILAIYSVLIAPISEELIFRGVTMHYAARIMPFWVANIFQALLFGIFHGNMVQGTYAFMVGLFCGYVCHKGGSIYLSILFHMMFNLWGTFVPGSFMYAGNAILPHVIICGASIGIAVLGFYVYTSGCGLRRKPAVPGNPAAGSDDFEDISHQDL